MPKVDYGHFYKFVASLGLLLIALSVSAPWFVSQSMTPLTITEAQVRALTPMGQDLVTSRQSLLLALQGSLPRLSVLAFIIGVACLIWGLLGWRRRQEVQDRGEDIKVATDDAHLQAMSVEQVDQKLTQEVVETEGNSNESVMDSVTSPQETAPAHSGPHVERARFVPLEERMARLRAREAALVTKLNGAYGDSFAVSANVKITDKTGVGAPVDAVITPGLHASQYGQLAFDVYSVRRAALFHHVSDRMMRLAMVSSDLKGGAVYTGARGRPPVAGVRGVVFAVIEDQDESALESITASVARRVEKANNVLSGKIGVILISGEKFDSLNPVQLKEAIAFVWKESGGNFLANP